MRPQRNTRLTRQQGRFITINGVTYQTPFKKARKPLAIVFPENISSLYAKKVLSYFQPAIDNVITILNYFEKKYLDDDLKRDANKMLKDILREIDSIDFSVTDANAIVEDIQTKIVNNNDMQYSRSMQSSIGVNIIPPDDYLKPLLARWSAENSKLIKTIQGDMKAYTQKVIEQYTTEGLSAKELSEAVKKISGLPEWKAERIARTETNKLFTQMSRNKSNGLGIKRYSWHTAGDAAVRDQHARNNGQTFSYETGDSEGNNPGDQINCRCTDIPRFDDLLR